MGLAEAAHAIIGDRQGARTTPAAGASTDTVRWGACTSAEMPPGASAVCGMLRVPLDYAKPAGAQIELALFRWSGTARRRRTTKARCSLNPAGPARRDWRCAGMGQRVPDGVGAGSTGSASTPRGWGTARPALSCDPTYFNGPRMPYVPASTTAVTKWLARARAYSAACAKDSGALLDHVTTVDAARDLDSIRKALGRKQISYYGYSYGTYLGQVYADALSHAPAPVGARQQRRSRGAGTS